MILTIRTDTAQAELRLLQPEGEELGREQWEAGRQLSVQLLQHIEQLLHAHQQSWKTLTGVVVFLGPGSFTGLRIGATVANTIAYAQDIPVVGTKGQGWEKSGVKRLKAGETDTQVQPFYGAEAHITQPAAARAASPRKGKPQRP